MSLSEKKFMKCFCVLLIYLFDFIFCATINDASVYKETFIIRYFEGRKIVPVKVELDTKNQIELIQILSTNNSWISTSLHDFIEGRKAYKDSNGSQCFISSANHETMEDDRKKLQQLNNGIVKGSYIPTFYILKEIDHKTDISENFGKRIAEFCNRSLVSLVSRDGTPLSRRKRQADGERNKFTHQSYGHYGHQSNNYAHYGHDTRITGTIDKDGNIKDQTMTQYQERSQSSQTYPLRGSSNFPHTSTINGRNTFSRSAPNQNERSQPDNTGSSRGLNIGSDRSEQFSLQTAQESGYQLNLPFGLKAGNAYRGGISSSGQYGASRGIPHHLSEQKPELVSPGLQSYPRSSVPSVLQVSYPGSHLPSAQGIQQQGEIPGQLTSLHTGLRGASPQRPEYKHSDFQPGIGYQPGLQATSNINGQQTDISPQLYRNGRYFPQLSLSSVHQPALTGNQYVSPTHPGMSYQPGLSPDVTITGSQPITTGYQPISLPRGQTVVSGYQPSLSPGTLITSAHPVGSGYQPSSLPGTVITGGSPATTGYTPGSHQGTIMGEFTPGHQSGSLPQSSFSGYRPGNFVTDLDQQRLGETSRQYMPQAFNGNSIPTDSRHYGTKEGGISVPGYEIPGMEISQPRYPESRVSTDQRQIPVSGVDQQISRDVPGISSGIPTNLRALDSVRSQPRDVSSDAFQGGRIVSREFTSQPTSVSGIREPGYYSKPQISDTPSYNVPGLTLGGVSDGSRFGQNDLRTGSVAEPVRTSPLGRDSLSERGVGDSASSQTQVQTGAEGTAAEASSAGQYRGLGSKTQVQGGYAGNGSFSAQAQSGFSGGITQSQVQGGKQGGLSGSSATVENLGSAQSQVQIGRPSGSASSTAQGQFSHGMTSVRAQSGRTGGSAGAESQSRGLSSSQVQVDIAGKEASENSDFQGTVSASVLGGSSSGQSQTQLQGGYNTGRTYAATAQGGFDASGDYQGSVPILGASPVKAGQALNRNSNIIQTPQLLNSGALHRPSINGIGSPSTLVRETGSPVSMPVSIPRQDQVLGSRDMPGYSQIPGTEYISRTPSKPHVSTGRDISQDTYHQRAPGIRYPSQSPDPYPTSHLPSSQPGSNLPETSSYVRPLKTVPGTFQTNLGGRAIPFDQQYLSVPGGQPPMMQPHSGPDTLSPSNLQGLSQTSYDGKQPSNLPTIPYHPGYYPLEQSLTDFSQPTQSAGYQGRDGVLQPSLHTPEEFQPSSPASRTQNGFLTPGSSTQFGQPPHYINELQNGNLHQISSKRDQSAVTDTGNLEGSHLISYPQSHFTPGQYQPSLQPELRPSGQTSSLAPRPSLTPGQPISSPTAPQSPTTDRDFSGHLRPTQRPGVREPDSSEEGSCCEALKSLKKRCCGRTTQKQNGSCCSSIKDDFLQDFEDDDITDGNSNKEPCKVVKAICYIVYKPAGKARICKPTTSNSC